MSEQNDFVWIFVGVLTGVAIFYYGLRKMGKYPMDEPRLIAQALMMGLLCALASVSGFSLHKQNCNDDDESVDGLIGSYIEMDLGIHLGIIVGTFLMVMIIPKYMRVRKGVYPASSPRKIDEVSVPPHRSSSRKRIWGEEDY